MMTAMKSSRILIALAAAALAAAPALAGGKTELRGIWVCPWEMPTPAAVDEVVDFAASYGFNALFYEVRYRGDAFYTPNKKDRRFPNPEPRARDLASQPPGWDPLDNLVAKGHARGLQVHAWVTTFVVANKKTPTPAGHPVAEHPEWLSQTKTGETWDPYGMAWLDPGLPAVQDYLYNVFMDIVVNYNVDGLHLDYVRYTSPAFGRNPAAIARFEAESGVSADDENAFAAWRREQLNAFVGRLYEGMAKAKPGCALTTAVFASRRGTAYNDCLQDWTAWLEGGYVDAVAPMAYGRDVGVVTKQVLDAVGVARNRYVYAGIMVPEVKDADFDDRVAAETVAKTTAIEDVPAAGVIVFSYGGLVKKDMLIARALKKEPFAVATAAPAMPWKQPFAAREMEVVALAVGGEPKYAVLVKDAAPHRYSYLLAKEVSARTSARVFIKEAGTGGWRVYAGDYADREAALDLSRRLEDLGYRNGESQP